MASRRRARIYALQVLFERDPSFNNRKLGTDGLWTALSDVADDLGEASPHSSEKAFAQAVVEGVEEHMQKLDAMIDQCSTNWRVGRMPVVDRNILRIAAYEMAERADIPNTVSINEAIELAKQFGTEQSRAFVNGIVDRMNKELQDESSNS